MYKNLVFKGGGIRGLAYAGSLSILEKNGLLANLERVAGTSAGAITAGLVALKYTAEEIHQQILALDFSTFEDHFDPFNVVAKYGLYEGKVAESWIESFVAKKAGKNATFRDLRNKGFLDLHVVATKCSDMQVQIFSFDSTPDVIVSQAIRASMSIPFFFWAMKVDGIDDLFVDGGEIFNYPLTLFDTNGTANEETLGLYLTDFISSPPKKVQYWHLIDFVKSNFEGIMNSQDIGIQSSMSYMTRSIRIDGHQISATSFKLANDQKQLLYNSGIDCTTKFLECQKILNTNK